MKFEIKKLERLKADRIDLIAMRIALENGLKIDITYDNLEHNLIVHKWYKLDSADLVALRKKLIDIIENDQGVA